MTQKNKIGAMLRELRPRQWTKNVVVMAALFFAYWDTSVRDSLGYESIVRACFAAALFCMVSSGIYLLNDIRDIGADRIHPRKRFRPLAAGDVSVGAAARLSIILSAGGLLGAYFISPSFALVVASYIALQMVYSYGLKSIALVDILVIASGFVLRAIAGAVVIQVHISPWLLLCTFLLALFLALCKRRHEKVSNAGNNGNEQRVSLEKYDPRLLDQLIAITSAATIVSYSIYTLWPETVEKFGTKCLGFTIPLVLFGIFRYLDLVYRHDKGDRPEKILLSDLPLLVDILLYGLTVILIFLLT